MFEQHLVRDRTFGRSAHNVARSAAAGPTQAPRRRRDLAALQRLVDAPPSSAAHKAVQLQRAARRGSPGLPDQLRSGLESLSGVDLGDVRVHANSSKPARVDARAYTQGRDIHLARGEERHLPHEAWHVVQQAQGRVQATTRLRGVAINDDPHLEHEADVMGERAVRTASPASVAVQRVATMPSAVQRVADESQRPIIDGRVDALKRELVDLLMIMKKTGEDWEQTYGKTGKEKASGQARDLMAGKQTDYPSEIARAALEEYWSTLTMEEKATMVLEAVRLGASAISSGIRESASALSGASTSTSSSRREPSARSESSTRSSPSERSSPSTRSSPSERSESSESSSSTISMTWLASITDDDIDALYQAYKLRGKALSKIAEAKAKIESTAGDAGEAVGKALGRLRNEADFDERMKSLRQQYAVAATRYGLIEEAIRTNDDAGRYESEMDAIRYALHNLHGPAMVYKLGPLNESARRNHPDVCRQAIAAIDESGRGVGVKIMDVFAGVGKFFGGVDAGELDAAHATAARELAAVVQKNWSKFTSWGFTPTGVQAIKKLAATGGDRTYLEDAKGVAAKSAGGESDSRHPETQIFYDAIAKIDLDDRTSVDKATSIIRQIGSKLS